MRLNLILNYDWAIANRGDAYRLMEHYEEALKDYDRAIELNPKLDLDDRTARLYLLLDGAL